MSREKGEQKKSVHTNKSPLINDSMRSNEKPSNPLPSEQSNMLASTQSIDLQFALLKIDYDNMKSDYTQAQRTIKSLTEDLGSKQTLITEMKSLQALTDEAADKSKKEMQANIDALQVILKDMTLINKSRDTSSSQTKVAEKAEQILRLKEKENNYFKIAQQESKFEKLKTEREGYRLKLISAEGKLDKLNELQSEFSKLQEELKSQKQEAGQAKIVFEALQSVWREITNPGEDYLNAETRKIVVSRIKIQCKENSEMSSQLSLINAKLGLDRARHDEVIAIQAIDTIIKAQEDMYKIKQSSKSFAEKVEKEFLAMADLFKITTKPVVIKRKIQQTSPQSDLSWYSQEIKKEIRQVLERERKSNIKLADQAQVSKETIEKLNADKIEIAKKQEVERKAKEDSLSMNSKMALQIKKNSDEVAKTKEFLSKSEANLNEAKKNLKMATERYEIQLKTMRSNLTETENKAKLTLNSTVKQLSEEKAKELSDLRTKLMKDHELQLQKITTQLNSKHLIETNRLKEEHRNTFTQASKTQSKVVSEVEREKTRVMNQMKEELSRKHEEVEKQMAETHRRDLSKTESNCEQKVMQANKLRKQAQQKYEQFAEKVERSFKSLSESFESICRRKIQLSLGNLDGGIQEIISTIQRVLATAKFFPNSEVFGEDMNEHKAFIVNQIEKYTGESVEVTKLIYHNDPLNQKSFHNYVDNKEHIMIICRLVNGKVIASYTAQAFRQNPKENDPLEGKGLLFSLNEKEVYHVKRTHNRNVITYDPFYLMVGNAEMRLRVNDMTLYSNFAIVNSFFDERGHKIKNFVGQDVRDIGMVCYEIYQIKFKGTPFE